MPGRVVAAAPLRLLSRKRFRRAWAAGALAGGVRWLEVLAVGWYVIEETGSPMAVALVLFLRQAPMFLLGAFAGAISERGDRRLILLIAFAALAAVMGLLALLAFMDLLTVHHVAAGVFCSGIIWALDFPVRRTMLGDLAGPSRFGTAMALDSSTANFTRMLGPLAGGVLMDTIGIGGAYLAGAACFAGGALLLLFTSYRRPPAPPAGRGLFADVRDAFAYLPHAPVVLGTVLLTVMMNVFGFPYLNMIPVIGRETLELQALATGSLMSAARRRPRSRPRWSSPRSSGRGISCASMSLPARRSSPASWAFPSRPATAKPWPCCWRAASVSPVSRPCRARSSCTAPRRRCARGSWA